VVFAASRRANALETLGAEHPGIRPVVLDVLVNAAGTFALGPVEAVPDDLVRTQFEVHLCGTRLIRWCGPR
jgi:NAD(P)-dependent dehydrogenase (short-subunit alcohol dehydrogenase family)